MEDGDSPALRRRLGRGAERRLLFAAEGPLTLYYGNDTTHAPHYDLAALRERLEASASLASAGLGGGGEPAASQADAAYLRGAARGRARLGRSVARPPRRCVGTRRSLHVTLAPRPR